MPDARDTGSGPPTGERPSVLIVEDRSLLAESLALALSISGIHAQIVSDVSPGTVLEAIEAGSPGLALVALGVGSGDLTEQIVSLLCERAIPSVVMTGGRDRLRLARCLANGAIGVVGKSVDMVQLIAMAKHPESVDAFFGASHHMEFQDALRQHAARITKRLRAFRFLTPREREVLQDLTMGLRAKDIAEHSFVAISTVRSQIKSILRKLGVSSQLEAVAMATRSGWFVQPARTGADAPKP